MSVWILHSNEDRFGQAELVLPIEGLPDLSSISDIHDCKRLLQYLHPGESPESLQNQADRIWQIRSSLQAEDVIAVPKDGQVGIATVAGGYHYKVGKQGEDIHFVPVTWHSERIPLKRFGKHKDIFTPGKPRLVEVQDKESRLAIYDKLPHSYNRFAALKWLVIILVGMRLVMYIVQQLGH